jgi:hypothetical protein
MDIGCLPKERAEALIARLGFLVVHDADRASGATDWHLIVALRALPAETHFDPERVGWWTTVAGRGMRVDIDRGRPLPPRSRIAWGPIHVDDRFHVANTFLTFGGTVRSFGPDEATSIVIVDSDAPILRWTGHSQDLDPLATDVAVFFARLRSAICLESRTEAQIAAMSPLALYAAFVEDRQARYERAPLLADSDPTARDCIAREEARLASTAQSEWRAGPAFLSEVGLRPAPAHTAA